jgi:ABC-type glycerol-3-phosphate transport system permease component
MENSETFLGLDPDVLSTIISTSLTVVSIFVAVTIGYYIYHYFFEKKDRKK